MFLRDRPDLHVFMLRRNPASVFAAGAYVFPGGAVDTADADPVLHRRIVGLDDPCASRLLSMPAGGLAFWAAAVREAFEESALLVARPGAGDAPAVTDPEVWSRLDDHRRGLNAGERTFAEVLHAEDLLVDADGLYPVSHFLTPEGAPRRYDTWFFLAEAPEGQEGRHDDAEAVDSEWVRPADALARHERGEIDLIAPTIIMLRLLARYEAAAEVVDAAEAGITGGGEALVVDDFFGERLALTGAERASAVAGWRSLRHTAVDARREGVA